MILKRVGILAIGGAIGQALQFLAQPILGHLYAASDFGAFGQITAISTTMVVGATLQMNIALVLPKDERTRTALFSAGLLSATIISAIALAVFGSYWEYIFRVPSSSLAVMATSAMIIAVAYSSILRGWQVSAGNFVALSMFSVIRGAAIVASQIVFGMIKAESGLLYGAVIGEVLSVVVILATGKTPDPRAVLIGMAPRAAWKSLSRYRQFAIAGTIQELVSAGASMMPLYLFARVYSASIGGQYAMAQKLIWAPVALSGAALSQVVYHHFASISKETVKGSSLLRFGKPSLLIVIAGLFALIVSPWLFILVLGGEWVMAASMSRWIVLWGISFLLCIPHRVLFRVYQCQHIQLLVDLIAAMSVLVVFHKAHQLSPMAAMKMLAVIGVIQNIVLALAIEFKARGRRQEAVRSC